VINQIREMGDLGQEANIRRGLKFKKKKVN
jgi:hypothetical protein